LNEQSNLSRRAKDLAVKGYHDFEASRAYYAAFYGAAAVLLNLAAMAALAICLWFFCRAMKGGQHER
jgi:hypothetical protein